MIRQKKRFLMACSGWSRQGHNALMPRTRGSGCSGIMPITAVFLKAIVKQAYRMDPFDLGIISVIVKQAVIYF